MYKIQTLNAIDPGGLSLFSSDKYQVSEDTGNPDAIVLRSFKMHDMELPPSLKAVARAGAGVNNIPIDKCTEKGIVVFNTPGANANGVKELVITGLLLTSRDIIDGVNWAKTLKGKGDQVAPLIEKGKKNFAGQEIEGKTLAVIGLGAIGVLVANAAKALGMNIVGYDPYLSVQHALKLSREVTLVQDIQQLLSKADYISINIPLIPETKGYINNEKFEMMKDGVRLLNFARGGLVDTNDLKEALTSGKVARYVTDFPDDDMLQLENVISIPHLGASTAESETNCAILAVKQVMDYLENGNIVNSVNFPAASMDRHKGCRLLITSKNTPTIISQISDILAKANLNTDNILSKKRDSIAYNIIDVSETDIEDNIKNQLEAIDGVMMVRILH
ncbi:MAG: 3-phosphoglycerate dehydrogenase [Draconibacterium sp.]|nr:MAG: 3-phosphoglycerate dehydrogenase [Draconibacterium sp.]